MNSQPYKIRENVKKASYDIISNTLNFFNREKVAKIIWVASYPRSGNTWLRKIIASLYGIEVSKLEKIDNAQKTTKKDGKFYWSQEPGNYLKYLDERDINQFLEKYQDSLGKLGY